MKHRGSWEENSSAKIQWQQASIPRDDQSRQHTHFRNDLFPKRKRGGKRTVPLQKSAFFPICHAKTLATAEAMVDP